MAKAAYDTGANTQNATTTPAITVPNPCDVIVAVVSEGADAAPVMSDSKGNVYTLIGTRQIVGATPGYLHIFRVFAGTGGSGFTVTATKANGFSSVIAMPIQGVMVLKLVEAEQKAGDESDPVMVRPINGGNLLVGIFAVGFPDREVVFSYADGFTQYQSISHEVGSEWALGIATQLATSRGEYVFSGGVDAGDEDPPYAVTLLNLANFAPPTGGTGDSASGMTGMSGLLVGDGL